MIANISGDSRAALPRFAVGLKFTGHDGIEMRGVITVAASTASLISTAASLGFSSSLLISADAHFWAALAFHALLMLLADAASIRSRYGTFRAAASDDCRKPRLAVATSRDFSSCRSIARFPKRRRARQIKRRRFRRVPPFTGARINDIHFLRLACLS